VLHIVSLLGHKVSGYSEFGYYPFRSSTEPGSRPTLQEWLKNGHKRPIAIHECPTVDARAIPPDVLDAAARKVLGLLDEGATVVVLDSAGAERTRAVCQKLGYSPANWPTDSKCRDVEAQ